MAPQQGLTVAVTGPTGDLGIALVSALERSRRVKRIVGMARRPFDPKSQGWRKTEYRQGDVQDAASVREAVKGADVVVHLAFTVLQASDASHAINVDGSRNVFEAAVAGGAERICYASSVAAYGFHDDNPDWLTEDVPPRGTPTHPYSAQKAEVEDVLAQALLKTERTHAWVFRPCIVAGPKADTFLKQIPYLQLSKRLPDSVVRFLQSMPVLKPVIPDIGPPFQLVHEDDVASAFVAGALGRGSPGPYNLAASGKLTMSDVADALGYYAFPLPDFALEATAEVVSRVPGLPPEVRWIEAVRKPVLMRTARAKKELGWKPKHTAKATLRQMIDAYREDHRPA
ncbi:MAG TPA: NAD-dependent epimerase/dehydratase family protein [Thermoleophilaceae bacterium]|jgi:nucleoside-diphosphate-sugar epimerase